MKIIENWLFEMTHAMQNAAHADALKKTGYWGKAGAGIIIMSEKTGRIMLGLRGKAQQSGTWSYPGGAIDEDEDALKAAVREAEEEVGLKAQYIKRKEKLFVFKDGEFTYTTFLFTVNDEFRGKEDRETPKIRWFALWSLPTPLHPGFKKLLDDSATRKKLIDLSNEFADKR